MSTLNSKQAATKAIKSMSDDVTMDDIIERLHFIAQVEAGIRDADDGNVISHDEMKKRAKRWLSK